MGLPEYDKRCYEAVEKKTLVTDRELTKFLTKEQMEKLIKQARNWSLCLGMDIVGGIGGGYTLTLVSDFLLGLATSKDWTVTHSFWHEFSHCMNWGHHQGNMCNLELPAPWGQQCWPIIASKLYVEELKKGNPPYIEDRKKFFNADLFSKEFFDPRKPENDEIKKDTLYIGERMPYSGSYKDHNGFSKVVFPPSVEVISGSAFYGTKLKEITIPSTVKKIEGLSFHSSYLTKIDIPDSVKSVGNAAFQNCKDLTSVKIGKGVRQLNYRLFKDSSLKEITIPANVQYIGDESFQGCKNLKKVVIENGVRKIGSNAFNGTGLKEIKIPASVTMFGKYITSKNVVWDVEEGSSAYQFALENKYRIKQNGEAADDDKILKENAARILAESSTAEAAPTNGWQKGTFKSKDVRRKWDFSDILEYNQVGEYVITFSYQGGACKLCLSDVLFVADDKPISFFPEMCSAGASPREIIYEIEVPTETKKLEMYALAKTSGGNDSRGTVIISMPDDGTTESKIARIMAEGETADDASSDNWNGGTFAKSEIRRKWNFSEYIKGTKGGKHIVTFRYEKGDNILC
ncbi:MAG: leucine-rich repeat domain-containing protein, partial [Spirochaetales bacterium]|nr:leucine-rich repeat domain-containing protein [Spirochaetales bacterium]